MTALQPDTGDVPGRHYLRSTPATVTWGRIPTPDRDPALTVESGDTITVDTLSHEGMMEDQGRDPLAYFASHGVKAENVLADLVELAASPVPHTFGVDGPHVVTGPVRIEGARPGDILAVEYLDLTPRVPYGVVSSRHGKGALPEERPIHDDTGVPAAIISQFCEVDVSRRSATMRWAAGRRIDFPIDPFLGMTGVTPASAEALSTVPPGVHGGNLDVRDVGRGATLYLPVQVEGAGFYVGDPHFAQGHGEVSLTALEASLRATVRVTVLPVDDAAVRAGTVDGPFAETHQHWVAIGLHADLDEAMRMCVRKAIRLLNEVAGVPESVGYLYLSAAADFVVSQVVDQVKGVHCLIRKADFPAWV